MELQTPPNLVVTAEDRAEVSERVHRDARGPAIGAITLVAATTVLGVVIAHQLVPGLQGVQEALVSGLAAVALGSPLLAFMAALAIRRGIASGAETQARERAMRDDSRRREFETRLANALDMAGTEPDALEVAERAFAQVVPGAAAELLLADNSHAHLNRVAVASAAEAPGCPVDSPQDCVAARRGQAMRFGDSENLDACPKLRGRPSGACSAVCVPVAIMGRSVGVLHTTSAIGSRVADGVVGELQVLANQVGARLGMLRVMAETQLQASTDGLTGLLNRRSFENQVRTLRRQATPFALVMGDLDYFKKLNDAHGHEAGDRALRLFAETLRTSLRPEDLVCRHGGEEFAIALPECSVGEAIEAMERVREELVLTLGRGDTPPFTASFGVTGSDLECDFEDLVRRADGALYRAKSDGRNRVVADDAPPERLLGPLFTRNGRDALGATSTTSEDP